MTNRPLDPILQRALTATGQGGGGSISTRGMAIPRSLGTDSRASRHTTPSLSLVDASLEHSPWRLRSRAFGVKRGPASTWC
jgi:hypothetical protein